MEHSQKNRTIENIVNHDMNIYADDRIAFVKNIQQANNTEVRLDAFAVALCLGGKGSLYVNGTRQEIEANDLIIFRPNFVIENGQCSDDFDYRCIVLSKEYLRQIMFVNESSTWNLMLYLEESPVLRLTEEESKVFCQYYDLIHSKLTGTPRRHQRELVEALLQAFLYEFHDMLARFDKPRQRDYSANERTFGRFIDLLSESFPKPRDLSFYADKLCITSKYLSTVCKKACGHTASELINRYVLRDIVYMLKRPDKSIKEICNELEFPNLSFFGRYVKKHLGMSPKQWRSQHHKEHGE